MGRDYSLFIPEYIAAFSALVIIGVELWVPNVRKDLLAYLTAAAALAWAIASLFYINNAPESFQGLIQIDHFTTFFRVLAAGIVFVTALIDRKSVV